MKIKEIMTREVEVIHPEETLQIAAGKMRKRDIGFLPVCDGDRLVGALTDRDISVRATAEGLDPKTTPVKDLATSDVVWCYDDQDVSEAGNLMKEKQVRRLMVVHRDDKKLVGVVSLGDIANNAAEQMSGDVLQKVSEPT